MNGLASFVMGLDDPAKLKILVETLGFGHLHLDVTVPRVVIFRDAIIDLFAMELGDRFNKDARQGWRSLLNYVGGAIIYVRVNYAVRVTTLLSSWKNANEGDEAKKNAIKADGAQTEDQKKEEEAKAKSKGGFRSLFGGGKTSQQTNAAGGEGEKAAGTTNDKQQGNSGTVQNIPTTYPEMFMFNCAVMGFGDRPWMREVGDCFHNIVTNVANSARLAEECDVLTLRISKVVKGNVNFAEYKSCMLASLRALLPKEWSTAHEVAWTWLWENVERLLQVNMGKPSVWEAALTKLVASLDEATKYEIRKDIYQRFFVAAPAGQDLFKQSNTYLHLIADKIIDMTVDIYRDPVKMVDDVSALGLRHVGYAIPTEFFGPLCLLASKFSSP
jgi:hemoglobin-like flavoprotein